MNFRICFDLKEFLDFCKIFKIILKKSDDAESLLIVLPTMLIIFLDFLRCFPTFKINILRLNGLCSVHQMQKKNDLSFIVVVYFFNVKLRPYFNIIFSFLDRLLEELTISEQNSFFRYDKGTVAFTSNGFPSITLAWLKII